MSKQTPRRRFTTDAAAPAVAKNAAPRRQLSPGAAVDESKEDPSLVLVTVPHDYRLTIDAHHEVHYKAGTQRMPKEHAEHWYTQAHGVTLVQ